MPSCGTSFRRVALEHEIAEVEQRLVARRAGLARDLESMQHTLHERLRKWRRLAGWLALGLVVTRLAGGKPNPRARGEGETPRRSTPWQRASTLLAVLELGWSLFESRARGGTAKRAEDGQAATAKATHPPPPSAAPATCHRS